MKWVISLLPVLLQPSGFLCHDKQKLPLWFGRWCGVECVYAKMMSSQIRLLTDGLFSLLRAQRCQLLLVWRSFIWDKEVRLLVIQPSSYRNICKGSTGDISCSWGKGVSKLKNVICTSQVSPLLSVSLCAEQRRQKKKLALTEDCWTVLKFNEWSQKRIKYLASYIIFLSISSPFNFLWLGLPL